MLMHAKKKAYNAVHRFLEIAVFLESVLFWKHNSIPMPSCST